MERKEVPPVAALEDELTQLEIKLTTLKREYEQYFLGTRPREPMYERGDVMKTMARIQQDPIKNTALRFKFNSINSRFQSFKRQWDVTLRQIEAGTYKRHVFKADLREKRGGSGPSEPRGQAGGQADPDVANLFETYRDAAVACGQDVSKLSQAKIEKVIRKQESAIREKLGCEKVDFRVVVEQGKVKLKASAG